jgi:type IV pilus assembly protein PilV
MLQPAQLADPKGFTLIEVMVAIFIMMVGMLGLLQSVNLAIAYSDSNRLRNDAIMLADQAMGAQRASAFNAAAVTTSSVIQHKFNLGFVNYSVVQASTPVTAGVANNLQITVSWRDKRVRKTHSLTTTIVNTAN